MWIKSLRRTLRCRKIEYYRHNTIFYLVMSGVYVKAKDYHSKTAVDYTFVAKNQEVVRHLLLQGTNVEVTYSLSGTRYHNLMTFKYLEYFDSCMNDYLLMIECRHII